MFFSDELEGGGVGGEHVVDVTNCVCGGAVTGEDETFHLGCGEGLEDWV